MTLTFALVGATIFLAQADAVNHEQGKLNAQAIQTLQQQRIEDNDETDAAIERVETTVNRIDTKLDQLIINSARQSD